MQWKSSGDDNTLHNILATMQSHGQCGSCAIHHQQPPATNQSVMKVKYTHHKQQRVLQMDHNLGGRYNTIKIYVSRLYVHTLAGDEE